jgi:PAS domain S-box-containing protein
MLNMEKIVFLLFGCSLSLYGGENISVNLTEFDVHIKRGFDVSWTQSEYLIDNTWKTVPGTSTNRRRLTIRKLDLDGVEKHRPFSLKSYPPESFSFVFDFNFPQKQNSVEGGYSLELGSIAYAWEIHLNGTLVEDYLHFKSDGQLKDYIREKRHLVYLPEALLEQGHNRLLLRIAGPPTWERTGLYFSKPYVIAPTKDLLPTVLPTLGAPFFATLFITLCIIWTYFSFKLRKTRPYAYLAAWCFVQAVYLTIRTVVPIGVVTGAVGFLRLEYVGAFLSVLIFNALFDTTFFGSFSRFSKMYISFCGLAILSALLAPPAFMHDVMQLWEVTLFIPFTYAIYCGATGSITKGLNPYLSLTKTDSLGLFFAVLMFLTAVSIDVINALFFSYSWYVSIWGSAGYTIIVSGIIFNKFIIDHKEIAQRRKKLSAEVKDKTTDLKAAHNELKAIFTALPDMYVRFDAGGTYLDVRGDKSKLYVDDDSLIGKTVTSRLPKAVADRFLKAITDALTTKEKISIEYSLDGGGSVRYFESVFAPFGNDEVVCSVRDVSSRKEAEKLLSRSEKEYQILVESMDEMVFVVDRNCDIIFANSHVLILSGFDLKNVSGLPLFSLFQTNIDEKIKDIIEQSFNQREARRITAEADFKSFQMWVEISFVPQIIDDEVQSVLGVARDITERVLYSRKLENLISNLTEQNEKVEALSSEVMMASEKERMRISADLHDQIGQALTAVGINLEVIGQNNMDVKEMKTRIRACQDLVNETASEVQRFAYELHPAILDDLGLIPAIRSHSRRFSESTGIPVNISGVDSAGLRDKDLKTVIYRIFQESLTNVAKHANANEVDVKILRENGSIEMTVHDNGNGFDVDALDSLSGFGIIGMKERVKMAGGKFRINSTINSGTTVKLSAPLEFGGE